MIDHRRLQRTLLRMQLDGDFAARLLAGEVAALTSTGLGPAELELLAAADPRAFAADRDGARRGQVLGNVSREFALACAWAKVALPRARLLEDFGSAPELHAALAGEGRLPLAFADYAERRARELGEPVLAALVRLEAAMARARRSVRAGPPPAAGELVLAPRAHLVRLPDGTLDHAAALREALEGGASTLPPAPRPSPAHETVLLLAPPPQSPHALPELHVERLSDSVARLLEAAATPLDASSRARLAHSLGAEPADLEAFADELVAEGALVRG